jgi:hypothetical protein
MGWSSGLDWVSALIGLVFMAALVFCSPLWFCTWLYWPGFVGSALLLVWIGLGKASGLGCISVLGWVSG